MIDAHGHALNNSTTVSFFAFASFSVLLGPEMNTTAIASLCPQVTVAAMENIKQQGSKK